MKKVFISQGMSGRSEEEVLVEREQAMVYIKEIIGNDFEIIDQYHQDDAPPLMRERLWYLGNSIKMMADADFVYFVRGWKHSYGCLVEAFIVMLYDIPHKYEKESDRISTQLK